MKIQIYSLYTLPDFFIMSNISIMKKFFPAYTDKLNTLCYNNDKLLLHNIMYLKYR